MDFGWSGWADLGWSGWSDMGWSALSQVSASNWADLGWGNWADYGWADYFNPIGLSDSMSAWASFSMGWVDQAPNLTAGSTWSTTQDWLAFSLKGFESIDFKEFAYAIGATPETLYPSYVDGNTLGEVIQHRWGDDHPPVKHFVTESRSSNYISSTSPLVIFLANLKQSSSDLAEIEENLDYKNHLEERE